MRSGAAWACLVAACSFRHGVVSVVDGADSNSSQVSCFAQSTAYAFCVKTPTQPITLDMSAQLHTGQAGTQNGCTPLGVYTMVGSVEACVIAGTAVTVRNRFIAVDDYPLVIAATGDVDIAGELDVSTPNGVQHGAGHNPSDCNNNGIAGTSTATGAGGGAGGSFGTHGGAGGVGDPNGAPAGDGGAAQPASSPTRLRGGCQGGIGGNAAGAGGNAGYGGGALLVAAYGKISVAGAINASGECGYPGHIGGGGGGGGSGGASGGMIALAASSYDITGVLVANGGGGGGGGSQSGADPLSSMGHNPSISSPSTPALGGSAGGVGGPGGDGAATASTTLDDAVDGGNATANGGGGGGGGGEGVIGFIGGTFPAPNNNISPTAIPL
jgi:hypothetical protein